VKDGGYLGTLIAMLQIGILSYDWSHRGTALGLAAYPPEKLNGIRPAAKRGRKAYALRP